MRIGCVKTRLLFLIMALVCGWCPVAADQGRGRHDIEQQLDRVEEAQKDQKAVSPGRFIEKLTWGAVLEVNYDYTDVTDTEDENSGSAADVYLDAVEFGLDVAFNAWVDTRVALIVEEIGKKDRRATTKIDEAIMRLDIPGIPLYIVGGKTVLPFGVFENHLISGTLTEDLYEIDDVGLTLGVAPDVYGLDMSLTTYRGQNIIENLEDFGTHTFSTEREQTMTGLSFIAQISLEPSRDRVRMAAFYDSAPGDGGRNRSAGGGLSLTCWNFRLDAEYVAALERENGEDGAENREQAWFGGLAFLPMEPIELAVRYEAFDDGRAGQQDEILRHRYLAGLNVALCDAAIISWEYRHSRFERESGSSAAERQNEFRAQLTLEF